MKCKMAIKFFNFFRLAFVYFERERHQVLDIFLSQPLSKLTRILKNKLLSEERLLH